MKLGPWLRENRTRLQFGLRMTLAGLITFGLGEALGLAQTYWAVLSAVIVIQGSAGGSLKAAVVRLIGTLGGAIWGTAVAVIMPHQKPEDMALALALAVAPLAVLTGFRPAYRVAPITAIIVLMGTAAQQTDPVTSAIARTLEIALGSAVAVAVVLFLLPARAHRVLARTASGAVSLMAELVPALGASFEKPANMDAILRLQDRIRLAIAATEAVAEEARLEHANRLADGPAPEPLVRNLRRLRHDLAMLGRAARKPFSDPVRQKLGEPLERVFAAISDFLDKSATALEKGEQPPALENVTTAISAYSAAMALARLESAEYETVPQDAERIFALPFIFEQLRQNLQDLYDRTRDFSYPRKIS